MRFYIRKSEHIQEDLKRGWSSWNFGQDGIEATEEKFEEYCSEVDGCNPLCISGFELFPDQMATARFGQLYPGYWVLIDDLHLFKEK